MGGRCRVNLGVGGRWSSHWAVLSCLAFSGAAVLMRSRWLFSFRFLVHSWPSAVSFHSRCRVVSFSVFTGILPVFVQLLLTNTSLLPHHNLFSCHRRGVGGLFLSCLFSFVVRNVCTVQSLRIPTPYPLLLLLLLCCTPRARRRGRRGGRSSTSCLAGAGPRGL